MKRSVLLWMLLTLPVSTCGATTVWAPVGTLAADSNTVYSSDTETATVSSGKLPIHGGLVAFLPDGYLGGFAGQNGNAASMNFLDGASGMTGSAGIGPAFAIGRADAFQNDGYAGNLPVVLTAPDSELA